MEVGVAIDLGVGDHGTAGRLDEVAPLLRAAEHHGFASLWIGESYPTSAADPRRFHLPNALMTACVLAARTRLHLGTGVSLLRAWHPRRFAHDAALADQFVQGRLSLGLALGPADLEERFGRMPTPRSISLEESIQMMHALWRGASSFTGELHQSDAGIWPLPARAGGPRLLIGGARPQAARRAARLGEGYIASSGYTLHDLRPLAAAFHEERARMDDAGVEGAVVVNRITLLNENHGVARTLAQRHVRPLLSTYAQIGTFAADVDDPLAGEVALTGTPDAVRAQLERYRDIGVTAVNFRVAPAGLPMPHAVNTLQLLAEQVLPDLAGTPTAPTMTNQPKES